MISRISRPLAVLPVLLALSALAAPKDDVSKPLKTVIQSVRYNKDLLALKSFAGEEQGKVLMAEDWAKGTDAQKKEFVQLFHTCFAKLAFPKIRKNFENLDTVLYDEPTLTGDKAQIGSTILINHPMKKQELKLRYDLIKKADGWKVIDVTVTSVGNSSMLTDIREGNADALKAGWDNVLKILRDKAKELESVPLK
jgi:phospholipid transport system substrate-binding protein